MTVQADYVGMYADLYYVDPMQRVIAASAPKLIGQIQPIMRSALSVEVPKGEVFIEGLHSVSQLGSTAHLVVRVPVRDDYSATDIGQLYALFNMDYLSQLLDKASSSASGDRYIALLDNEGKMISASSALRKPEFLSKSVFADWKPENNKAVFTRKVNPITQSPVVTGYASSKGHLGYAKMGWSVIVIQNTAQAYFSIDALWVMFITIIFMTLLLAFGASYWLSGRIIRPLLGLTQWVQTLHNFGQQAQPYLGAAGIIEIHELKQAFNHMLKELESSREQCVQASKLAVIGEMSAIMAHEVRTPLGILSSAAQCLQREQGLSPQVSEITRIILDESNRLNKLVTSLLDCASPRAPKMLDQNIHELLANVVLLLKTQAEKKRQLIRWNLLPYQPIVEGDSELLTQAFLNLLLNAIQITPEQGIIQIASATAEAHVSIEIADNGPGINPEDSFRLFDPFFTKRDGGIGLGLTVTQQIIMVHQGSISAKRNAWGGATFTVLLPLTQE